MFKNVASQKIAFFAFDYTTGAPKTGDAANLTAYVNKDWAGVTVLGDTSASELSSTNAPGWYVFDLTQAETNADALSFTCKSATGDVSVVGHLIFTTPASFTSSVAQTGDSFARLGAPAGASVSADILVLDNLVDDLESRVGTPSNLGGGATISANLADIEAQTDDIGAAGAGLTALATQASVNAIDDILDTEFPALVTAVADLPTNAELATALGTADDAVLAQIALVKATTDKLDDTLEDDAGTYRFTTNSLEQAPTGGGAADGSGFTDIPWNPDWDAEVQSEVADALAAYDPPTHGELVSEINSVQSDIAALNNLSSAQAQTAAAAALTAYDPPTRAEATSDANSILTAVGDVPTNSELATALDPLPTAAENATAVWAAGARTLTGSQGIKKNEAKAGFMFLMTDDTDHEPATGLTVTATRSLDGAAFAACANSVTEVSAGWYKITLAAADLNGDTVALKFTATGADTLNIALVTGA